VPSAHRLGVDPIPRQENVACWKVDIGELFPVPQGDISITDLVAFRERYAVDVATNQTRYDHRAA
jgi:hypothetical protein